MKRGIVSIVFAISMLISTVSVVNATTANTKTYQDVKNSNWAYEAISTMSSKAVIHGYPDGTFKPQNTLTYGEFIKMALVSATGNDAGNAEGINTKTGLNNHWAQNYYDKAIELKYFTEHQIHSSKLDNQISRGDMALMISSILGDVKIQDYDKIQFGIKDVTSKTTNEYDIIKSYASGILTGYEDNTFKPDKTLTRAESAVVIHRLVDESKRVIPGAKKEQQQTKNKVSDIVKNYNTFKNTGNGTIDQNVANAKSYTIINDSTPYNFSLHEKNGVKWLDSTGLHLKYLMKDGNIVEFMQSVPNADGTSSSVYKIIDIKEADYIVSIRPSTEEMLLIVNPFKK